MKMLKWGRRKPPTQQQEEQEKPELERKSFFSLSWLSKLIPKANSTSPKCPSCEPKHVPNLSPIQNTKQQTPPYPSRHVSTFAPHRRSVRDSDRPLPPLHLKQRRHHSFDESNLATSSVTLGHVIPFSFVATKNEDSSWVPKLDNSYRNEPDPTLLRNKMRRKRRTKNRPVVTANDETCRKSFSGRIRTRKHRIRVSSPRRQAAKDKLESMVKKFAVVKRSNEPERDFRESMVEMILEKRIGRSDQLESLLACYLTLNSDEYHDVIVKVFRQVWYEINPERFVGKII
ncbi:hypothetical protein LUZ60_008442 [Juncus effusus]|nr:hypothetical protein LUZ60_008442 [Juncus effusus]